MVMQSVTTIVKQAVRHCRANARQPDRTPMRWMILPVGFVLIASRLAHFQGERLATVAYAVAFVGAILTATSWGKRVLAGEMRPRWLTSLNRSAARYFVWACFATLLSMVPLIPANALAALIEQGVDLRAIVDQQPFLARLLTVLVLTAAICLLIAVRLAPRIRLPGRDSVAIWGPGHGRTARLVMGSLAVWLVPILVVFLTVGTIDRLWPVHADEPLQDSGVATAPEVLTDGYGAGMATTGKGGNFQA